VKLKKLCIKRDGYKYQEAIEWIQGIKYFRASYLSKIRVLPRDSVIETYPHVRYMWEKGKIDKPGGIYKAFLENWRDQDLLGQKEALLAREKEEKARELEEVHQVVHERFIAPAEKGKAREEMELAEATRKAREEDQAKEKEDTRRKQETHRMEIMAHIATTGKERLSLLGGKILECKADGVVVEKGADEILVGYGNILIGVNLK